MRRELKFFAGVAIGIGIGAATGNIGIGIGIGIAFGAAFAQTKNEQKRMINMTLFLIQWVKVLLESA